MVAWIYWDPSAEIVILPFINIPITWYGLFFATGFWIGLQIFTFMFKKNLEEKGVKNASTLANAFAERLLLYVIVATVVGARLGHIFFYEHPMEYLANPISILKTWEGGLASHGAVLAIVLAIFLFSYRIRKEYPDFTFLRVLDYLAIPAMFAATMIRIGNFFNQEILGRSTEKFWGIIFGHPADGGLVTPRHPAQLYEAAFYFTLFIALSALWLQRRNRLEPGRIAGITLFFAFLFRFLIEFVKTEQSIWFDKPGSALLMGQVLSLPIVALGLYLMTQRRSVKAVVS